MLYSEMVSNGIGARLDAAIKDHAAEISAIDPSNINPYKLLSRLQRFAPFQLTDITGAIAPINSNAKNLLIRSGVMSSFRPLISLISGAEQKATANVNTSPYQLRKMAYCEAAALAGVFALGAVAAGLLVPGVDVVVIAGVGLEASDVLLIGAGVASIAAGVVC